ncbi:MAG: hypothetical protein ABL957_03025, partial [Parvularculaceae bacterium]
MGLAAAFAIRNEKLAIERLVQSAANGQPANERTSPRNRARERLAQASAVAALLGIEGCLQ